MKVPDVNVLLAAVNPSAPAHETAKGWLAPALSSDRAVGFAWIVLLGFVRIGTKAAAFPSPLTIQEAFDYVDGWLAQPHTELIEAGPRHSKQLREMLEQIGTAGDLTTDAHLAAIAIHHNATLVSFDADFERFEGLRFQLLS